jgi:hypothetical protein
LKAKTQQTSHQKSNNSLADFDQICLELMDCMGQVFVTAGIGFMHFFKLIVRHPVIISVTILALYYATLYVTENSLIYYALYDLLPKSFYFKVQDWLNHFPLSYHQIAVGSVFFSILVFCIGIPLRWIRSKYHKIFETVGLKNRLGETPIVTKIQKMGKYQKQIKLNAKGIGIDTFRAKSADLETLFNRTIESITLGKTPKFININITSKVLPNFIAYSDNKSKALSSNCFLIGEALEGDIKANLSTLPHLMIAGTTGGGKSNFFKHLLLNLLKSTQKIQMYLIDLKGGLEMIDFKEAPNVKVTKNIQDSLKVLKLIEVEMNARFQYLEKNNKKVINPKFDPYDRIVCAIDEASLLYAKVNRLEDDYEEITKAKAITDRLTKLGRAAGIHIIFATQKVTKETISTSIQENISARICFKMNTMQGSLQVLGNGDATNLPEIPGRGIWSYGTKRIEVQTPYIDSHEITSFCRKLKENGVELNQELLGSDKQKADKKLNQNLLQELF